ncbi:MAG: alanine:cation symporter family protein [Clostridia bacterium]|nr:alanine:cation symporter family protein [Clostridia bacterium]
MQEPILLSQTFVEWLTEFNDTINNFVWVKIGIALLLGTGILTTLITKVFQVTHLGHWMKRTLGSIFNKKVTTHTKEKASISQFQALCTALAATIGVGNIAGVAAAITTGGAGAVFWMWVAAFFGMMTNYSENILGIFYRRKNAAGEWSGGAMYYIRDGLGSKKQMKIPARILAVLFSAFCLLASLGIGNMGQVNKIVINFQSAFEIESLSRIELYDGISLYSVVIGVVLMLIAALIILGGLKRIASFAEKIVPFMVIAFVVGSLVVIGANYDNIIPAFKAIFVYAFNAKAAVGGTIGFAIKTVMTCGFKRGIFSNEAGLGSSVMVHCNSNVKEPVQQGMWGIFEVFADTMVVCTMTALVVLTSTDVVNLSTGAINPNAGSDATLVAEAFNNVFHIGNFNLGRMFIAIAILLFAFTTVLGWSHYGTKAWEYLFGTKSTIIYKIFFVVMIMSGALMTSSLAWDISDTFNGLMMLPNLIGVICLSGLVIKLTKNYVDRNLRHKDVPPMLSYDPDIQAQMEAELSENSDI